MHGKEIVWDRSKEWGISLYKGEGRIMINPEQPHKSGLTIASEEYTVLQDVLNAKKIGEAVFKAIVLSQTLPVSQKTHKEISNSINNFKGATKCRTWISFWKNNLKVYIIDNTGLGYSVASCKKSTKKGYFDGLVKCINLPYTATAEEIGQAVIDVFQASEEYHANMEKEQQIQDQEKK